MPTKSPFAIVDQSKLLALATDSGVAPSASSDSLGGNMLAFVNETKVDLGLQEGEYDMWFADLPDASLPATQIIIAAKDSVRQGNTVKPKRVVGVCRATVGPEGVYKEEIIYPAGAASTYMYRYEQRDYFYVDSVTRIAQQPKHGKLVLEDKAVPHAPDSYKYIPDKGFDGHDTIIFEVEKDGIQVQVRYHIEVASGGDSKSLCPGGRELWRISLLDTPTIRSLRSFTGIESPVSVEISDLAGGAVGSTQGASITLDDNAAGHGWFIDPTPDDNSEFLPTADANIWIAKAGSDAAGKMDLLSVLLHEYGHALGIEHSADSSDFMAATLQPGVRRLPSSEELALMAQLVGEAAGRVSARQVGMNSDLPDTPINPSLPIGTTLSALLIGRLRRTDYGSWSPVFDSVQTPAPAPQFAIAANPKLQNPAFNGGAGWSTGGAVAFGSGAATLTETAATQTRLNQVFVLGEHDRFLSFTLANTALGDQTGPDDAFEVALLDANTGLSLLGSTGLSHNDAILNLQANGTEHKATGITRLDNPDGSHTYLVDLAGIPAGTTVNLAFDLIGFGHGAEAANSQITVRDLRLGVPQTADDSVTLAEDTPTAIDVLTNDLNARQPGFAPVVVSAPAHGQVTVNTDGSFSFTPDQDWHGQDTFTYKLSDGCVDSRGCKKFCVNGHLAGNCHPGERSCNDRKQRTIGQPAG